jgi:hypothetical protein
MRRTSLLLFLLTLLAACGDVTEIKGRYPDPSGKVELMYSTISGGGAAGFVGHCFVLSIIANPDMNNCDVLGSHVAIEGVYWAGISVNIVIKDGYITRYVNNGFKRIGGVNYRIRIVDRRKTCDPRDGICGST